MEKRTFSHNLEFWMTDLPKRLRNIPIIHLAIPGSHDSTTFQMNKNSKISPDARKILQCLKFLTPILHPMILKWSKTQCVDVVQQLNKGVRYFDLRIAMKANSDGFYFVHNLYSCKVSPVLEDIDEFLQTHPNEVVILDCQHFYNMSSYDHRRFISLLQLIFGLKLLPYSGNLNQVSLDSMTVDNFHQVILIYRADLVIVEELLWPSTSFPTPWPDTTNIPQLISFLCDKLRKRNDSYGYVSQCVLTPTVGFALKYLFSSLKNKCVIPLEGPKYEWIQAQRPGKKGVNIIISDFVEYQDYKFCKEVIMLNDKLLTSSPHTKSLKRPNIKTT